MASPRPASLARRALPAVAIAGVSGAVLLQLDQPRSSALAGQTIVAGASTSSRAASATTAVPSAPPTTIGTAVPSSTTAAVGRPSAASSSTAPTAAATATVAPAAASESCTAAAVDGPTVDTRWGPVRVAAVFTAAGRLCEVQALVSPSDHRKSVQINQYALPVLHREALAAGSAAIDIVSGATITSDAYAASLQAILDARR